MPSSWLPKKHIAHSRLFTWLPIYCSYTRIQLSLYEWRDIVWFPSSPKCLRLDMGIMPTLLLMFSVANGVLGGDSIALKNRLSFRLSFKRKLKRFFKRIFITAFLQFIHMSLENGTLKRFFKRKFMQLNCHPCLWCPPWPRITFYGRPHKSIILEAIKRCKNSLSMPS